MHGPTNLKVWVVLAQSGNYVSHQEFISSGTDHGCVVSSVADGTYDYFYVITSLNAWTNFVASGDNTLSNLQHYVTYCYNPQSQITVSSSCSSLTSGGSVSTPSTTSGCASLNPDQMNNSAAASGGSGGTINYLWEKSTDGGSTWVTTNGTNAYLNPATISQTTLFRRGASRCATASVGGSEQYTSSVTFTVNANPSSVSVSGGGNTCGTRPLLPVVVLGVQFIGRILQVVVHQLLQLHHLKIYLQLELIILDHDLVRDVGELRGQPQLLKTQVPQYLLSLEV